MVLASRARRPGREVVGADDISCGTSGVSAAVTAVPASEAKATQAAAIAVIGIAFR